MPARGIAVVRRLLTDVVRAAHFGHFDLLVLHFDLDDTFLDSHGHVHESSRCQEIRNEIDDLLLELKGTAGRTGELCVVFMTPAQSTDAWLRWALMNGDGKKWECKDRHTLKKEIFGSPPRKMVEIAGTYAAQLLTQMSECALWPRSLRDFQCDLEAFRLGLEKS